MTYWRKAWFILSILTVVLVPTFAMADCYYEGKKYPEGARIGFLVCENGEWVVRPEASR